MSGEISQAKTGNGKAFGHGMKQQDIGQSRSLSYPQNFLEGKGFIGLVDDKELPGMFLDQPAQSASRADFSRGIIRIAEPYKGSSAGKGIQGKHGLNLVGMQTAGIGIFTESRHQNG